MADIDSFRFVTQYLEKSAILRRSNIGNEKRSKSHNLYSAISVTHNISFKFDSIFKPTTLKINSLKLTN